MGTAKIVPYPDSLKRHGVVGDVVVQFVVDARGKVDSSSMVLLKSPDERLTALIRRTIGNLRFEAAEVGGRKVKQVVIQKFIFGKHN